MDEKKRVVFLDRDGTINVEKHYLYKIEEFEFVSGALTALKRLSDLGYILVIITNQSGIARGYYSQEDLEKLNGWMIGQMKGVGIEIFKVYYCPHLPDAKIYKYRKQCNCRKPKLGLFKRAISDLQVEYKIDWENSIAIGDKVRDLTITKYLGCKGFLIGENEQETTIRLVKNNYYTQIKWSFDLLSVVNEITH